MLDKKSTMEAWLAQLEMGEDPVCSLINSPYQQYQQSEAMEASLDEQLGATATLGSEAFPYPFTSESNTTSPPQWNFDCDNLIEQFTPRPISNSGSTENLMNYQNIHNNDKSNVEENQHSMNKEENRPKRKRQPSQVHDHILAERKRRELHSQMFISLSAIVPGLKKMDKTSVLGEAIKYMKQLQEKVKTLEEEAAKRNVESVVVVRKSQLIVNESGGDDNNDTSSTVDDICSSGNSGCNDNFNDRIPEIEVKISGKALLLRVYCENQQGILAKLIAELEKHDVSITNCSVIPFESLALNITILAQMEKGLDKNVKDFVSTLCSSMRFAGRQHNLLRENDNCG